MVWVFCKMKEAIMETITYDHSRADLFPMVILSFVLCCLSFFLLYLGMDTDFILSLIGQATNMIMIICGSMGVLFFGYSFFYVLYRFIFPKNALVINDRGIINQTNVLGSKENIPFETMKTAKLENIHGKQYIGIKLYNEEEYLDRLSVFKRILQESNQKNFGTSIISMSVPTGSEEDLHKIVELINERIEITEVRKEMNW